ncbi:MAG: sulfite exporter TauE/SafE family protein [Aquificota bacterium]|nr:MAG: sulfite exporter TauE/SafE family protein [Aquificota bacterium]
MFIIPFLSLLLGWIVQGFIGIGSGIISTAILLFLFDAKTVVVSLSILALLGTFILTVRNYRGNLFLKEISLISIFSVIGVYAGSFLLEIIDKSLVEAIFGLVVFLTGLYDFFKRNRKSFKPNSFVGGIVGLVGGVISGLIGGAGPLYAFYIKGLPVSKEDFKFILSFVFFILNVFRVIFYFQSPELRDYFSIEILIPGLLGTILGVILGDTFSKSVPNETFKNIVSITITGFGIYFLFEGLFSL